ncbi:hypothetical protein IW261DRAFT_1424246 [Armillaria novae-zelandiae]|uniref:JmjC domain-containing protein n=1 Tax=Armillaria novae-zelandiae TaxID=153914 RepID=A0AA39NVH1_9AGAR|nr:hypothetical protein IW261DRAFT_1424246 [Armillaria novae-zelandiae]
MSLRELFEEGLEQEVSATSFWLVATKGAISYMHCDCHGVGTVVEVLCGRKLWYIFRRRGSSADDSMIEEYMGDWAPGFIPSPDEWEAEVVLLEPGSALVMTNDDNKGFHYLEIPEMSRNGLLDIIALGNLCIFSSALLPCIEESPEQVKIAIAMATGAYLSLIRKTFWILGFTTTCDMFESSQASVKHMEMKDFDGKETDNEGSFDEEEQSQSGDQDEENSEDASGSEYKP